MGKKYVIELEDDGFFNHWREKLYRVKGFNSLVFDKIGLNKLTEINDDPAYKNRFQLGYNEGFNKGYKEGIKLSRSLALMTYKELEEANIPQNFWDYDFESLSMKYDLWKKHKDQKIKINDVVQCDIAKKKLFVMDIEEDSRMAKCKDIDGKIYYLLLNVLKKID